MRLPLHNATRQGMTLLEVLLALAIFLFSLVAISQLFNTATSQANEVMLRSRATRLAQSKMAEFTSGVLRLESGGSGSFEEDSEPDWNWDATSQSDGSANGLYLVTITVSRESPSLGHIETSLTQYVLDPRVKGNIPAPTPTTSSSSTTTTDSASTTGSSSTSTSTTPATGSSSTSSTSKSGGTSSGSKSGSGSSGAPSGGNKSGMPSSGGTGTPSGGGTGMPSGGSSGTAPTSGGYSSGSGAK